MPGIRFEKKKSAIRELVKNAVRFVGSTMGIVKDGETGEGALPKSIYPAGLMIGEVRENDYLDGLYIEERMGDVPLWMRSEHVPDLKKRQLKRRLFKSIRERKRLLKQIERKKTRSDIYAARLGVASGGTEEIYQLRTALMKTLMENRELDRHLVRRSGEHAKLKFLTRLAEEGREKLAEENMQASLKKLPLDEPENSHLKDLKE